MGVERVVQPDLETLSHYTAEFITAKLEASTGKVAVALSGGSTPKRLYQLLATPPFVGRVPWQRTHWFWGDERFVPPDHPDSNYLMTRTALFSHVDVPQANLHPVPTVDTTPEKSAAAYEAELQDFYGRDEIEPAKKLFLINLLGMGDDGHTASLFPGIPELDEKTRWVVPIVGVKSEDRITLTYPALGSAEHVLFLIAGASKQEPLHRIAAGEALPAGRVHADGTLHWLLDNAAAG